MDGRKSGRVIGWGGGKRGIDEEIGRVKEEKGRMEEGEEKE